MTQKEKMPAKRSVAARKSVPASAKARGGRPLGEVDELRQKLEAANARIAILERQRDEALNRIEWVIDSIKTLAETVK